MRLQAIFLLMAFLAFGTVAFAAEPGLAPENTEPQTAPQTPREETMLKPTVPQQATQATTAEQTKESVTGQPGNITSEPAPATGEAAAPGGQNGNTATASPHAPRETQEKTVSTAASPDMEKTQAGAQNAASAAQEGPKEILTHLPNGLLVYIIRDNRFPLVCSRLYVRCGSANEEPSQAGISHVLEHMVFKGSSHKPDSKIARDVEELGGYLNAATSFDKTWYLTDMPATHWKAGIAAVRDLAFQPSLDEEALKSEKEVVISELERGEDSPMRALFEDLQTATLKNTPYGRPIIGYTDTIRALTVADLRAYIKKWYQPQNMMLLVAGNIQPGEVLAYAQELFGKLENSSDLPVPEPFNLDNASAGSVQASVNRGPWNKVYLGVAVPAPALRDLRSIDLDVLTYLLGGDATSWLHQKYKYELQLVDSIDASNMSMAQAGMLTITALLDADKVQDFWERFTSDMAALNVSAFNADAIKRAKFNLEDSMDRAGETLNGIASWKASVQFDLGGEIGEENIRFTQRNVNSAQLQNAISTWLNPRQARVRVLAPENVELPDFGLILAKNWPAPANSLPQETRPGHVGTQEIIPIANGCQLILIPDNRAPYISIAMLMSGGNAMLKSEQQGLAHLTARLLTDGCGSMGKPVLERWLAERAASVSAHAGLQTFSLSLSGPARFNGDYFSLIRDILRKPKFDPAEYKREMDDIKAALRRREDQPLAYMFSKVNPFLFPGGQAYGYDNLGDAKTLDSFNVVMVRDFWTLQSGQPWTMAIAGSFDREEVLKFAQSLPAPRMDRIAAPTPTWDKSHEMELRLPGRHQAHLMRIFPTVAPTSPDAPGLMLLESILSGQSGLLFTRLRDEEGLGYTVTAFNRTMPKTGYLAFYIGATPEKLDQAKAGFSQIVTQLRSENLREDQLKAGANSLLGDYERGRQSLASRASEAATNAILDYPQDFQRKLIEKAAALTPEDLRQIAERYLHDPYDITLLP